MSLVLRRTLLSLGLVVLVAGLGIVLAQEEAAESEAAFTQEELQWPRVIQEGDTTLTVYQPQVDVFEDARLEARAAVQVETKLDGDKTKKAYGVVWITADAFIDKENRLVELTNIQIPKVNFPTAQENVEEYLEVFRRNTESTRTVSLDRIEANLAVTQADKEAKAVPIKNDPPKIFYRSTPAILVLIDGEPALRPVQGAEGIQHVINTKTLILQTGGTFYMPIADRWLTGPSATGPWQLASSAPAPLQSIRDAIEKDEKSQVDLMEEPDDDVAGVLKEGRTPEVIVSTVPAELIATQGKPQLKPVTSTQLLYVTNTTGDILFYLDDQRYYVPLTGRWFRARSLDGPWQFVEGDDLPKDFSKIPTSDPKASVLATVPDTPAAEEAVIANSIPQTAEVNREEATYESQYDGAPRFDAVPDTSLQYAVNSPTPVVRVDPTSYYAVQSGVWFTSASAMGPWVVATTVPPAIYTIPTASPIHYVTYVRVYRYTPTMVWVGYTPGYLGTCYSPWGTVVYGTGYYYQPWIGNYWYGAPWTWGFGAGFYWSPYAGWGWSFGWGGYRPFYNPWWGPYYGWRPRPPVYRPPYYGGRPTPYRAGYRPPYNWNNVNVYARPGAPRGVRPSVRPAVRPVAPARPGQPAVRPGQPAPRPGQPATRPGQPSTQPARPSQPSTRPAPARPSRPDNVYAGPDGNVYRPQPGRPGSWETNDRGTWKPVQPSRPETRPSQPSQPSRPSQPAQPSTRPAPGRPTADPSTLNQLSREQRGRSAGDRRMSQPPPSARPQPAPRSSSQSKPPSSSRQQPKRP
jgi:hypothetical protein